MARRKLELTSRIDRRGRDRGVARFLGELGADGCAGVVGHDVPISRARRRPLEGAGLIHVDPIQLHLRGRERSSARRARARGGADGLRVIGGSPGLSGFDNQGASLRDGHSK